MKKKIASIVLVACMVALAGCGSKDAVQEPATPAEPATEVVAETPAEPEPATEAEAPAAEFSEVDVMAKIVDYYTKSYPQDGDYVIYDNENTDNGDTMDFIVRYCMSDAEAQELIDNDGTPEANIYITMVTVNKSTLEATDESGDVFSVSEDAEYEEVAAFTLGDFSFADIAGKEFIFCSGAGAWATTLVVDADGNFEGHYEDSDMGDTGDDYPNGKLYYCDFDGKFDAPKMKDEPDEGYYQFYIDTMDCHVPAEKEKAVDGVLEVYSQPYGMEDTNRMRIYLPGTPVSKLTDEVKEWLFLEVGQKTIDTYVMENVDKGYGFICQ